MSVSSSLSSDSKTVTITINGRFDFKLHQDFRRAYESAPGAGVQYQVDMRGAEYMDSSALGMLLILREHAGGDKARVRIMNARGEIRNILTISNFQRLFQMD